MSNQSEFQKRGASKILVVMLHSYAGSPKQLDSIQHLIAAEYADADFYIPNMPASIFSAANPIAMVQEYLQTIDHLYAESCRNTDAGQSSEQGYEKIVLLGISLGSLLARKIYIYACGENTNFEFEKGVTQRDPRPWAAKVERIILLAGMNRGWHVSAYLSKVSALLWLLGCFIGNLMCAVNKPPLIFQIRRGATFLTQLRLHWLSMREQAERKGVGDALTIQLLGSLDDLVSPEDNIDLVSGRDFIYLDVPYSGHISIADLNDTQPILDQGADYLHGAKTHGEVRTNILRRALIASKQSLLAESVLPADLPTEQQRYAVKKVVFVVHGIRDKGFWTHKIARRIVAMAKQQGMSASSIATETSSYGYFPIISFFLPWRRRQKVAWLMDQYVECFARYPNAKFSFVGHSNGTYLLASALEHYPLCRFQHITFAGSVVRADYAWQDAFKRGQVKHMLNYVSTDDKVVAYFPRMFQVMARLLARLPKWLSCIPVQDLGGAGHDGFSEQAYIKQVTYIRGGHSSALHEANWQSIAHFTLTGETLPSPEAIQGAQHSLWVRWPTLTACLVWGLIVSLIAALVAYIWQLDLSVLHRCFLMFVLAYTIRKIAYIF